MDGIFHNDFFFDIRSWLKRPRKIGVDSPRDLLEPFAATWLAYSFGLGGRIGREIEARQILYSYGSRFLFSLV